VEPSLELALAERLVAWWAEEDPTYDALAWRARLLAHPDGEAVLAALLDLRERWKALDAGSYEVIPEHAPETPPGRALDWLRAHREAALPGLVLALRMPARRAPLSVDALLDELGDADVLEPVVRALESPGANLAWHVGGRSVHLPVQLVKRFVADEPVTRARVVALLEHDDFRCVHAAAWILAPHGANDACFEPLWAQRDRPLEGLQLALATAAEVRADRSLVDELRRLRGRVREPALRERFDEVIAALSAC
jgi:hypothetical protein